MPFNPHLLISWGAVLNRNFDLPSDDRPIPSLVELSQLYFGRRLDASGGTSPLSKQELQARWQELYTKYPTEFTVSPKAAVEWRIDQLYLAKRPDRTIFHRRWLAAELAEAGWQPGEHGNEDTAERDRYLHQLQALAAYGDHAKAVVAADELLVHWAKDQWAPFGCARVYALAAGAVKGDAALADRYAARAIALLRQSVANADDKDFRYIRDDHDLDALRHRRDFLDFLWDLAESR